MGSAVILIRPPDLDKLPAPLQSLLPLLPWMNWTRNSGLNWILSSSIPALRPLSRPGDCSI